MSGDVWKRKCSAKAKSTGKPCGRWAIRGGSTCYVHGSASAKARAAAARRMQVHRASGYAQRLGLALVVDPLEALLSALYQAAGAVGFWRALVSELTPAVGGAVVAVDDQSDSEESLRREWREGVAGPDHLGDARPHVFVVQYDAAVDRLAKIAKMALEAGVSERQIRIAEQQAELMATVIRGFCAEMGIVLDARANEILGRHLALAARTIEADVIEVES